MFKLVPLIIPMAYDLSWVCLVLNPIRSHATYLITIDNVTYHKYMYLTDSPHGAGATLDTDVNLLLFYLIRNICIGLLSCLTRLYYDYQYRCQSSIDYKLKKLGLKTSSCQYEFSLWLKHDIVKSSELWYIVWELRMLKTWIIQTQYAPCISWIGA